MENIRYRCRFCKQGPARFLGHLDLVRTMERALRRANLPLALSQGYHPHPQLSFAAPLAVGIASRVEVMEVVLRQTYPPNIMLEKVNAVLPPGLILLRVRQVTASAQAPMDLVAAARYRAVLEDATADLRTRVEAWYAQEQILCQRVRKGKSKEIDLKPLVLQLTVYDEGTPPVLEMLLRAGKRGSVRPEEVIASIGFAPSVEIERTGLYQEEAGELMILE